MEKHVPWTQERCHESETDAESIHDTLWWEAPRMLPTRATPEAWHVCRRTITISTRKTPEG